MCIILKIVATHSRDFSRELVATDVMKHKLLMPYYIIIIFRIIFLTGIKEDTL